MTIDEEASVTQDHHVQSSWKYDLFIDGAWRPARAAQRSSVVDPATEEVVGDVAFGDTEDASDAISAARRAFDQGPWPTMTVPERAQALEPALKYLLEHEETLLAMEVAECGSPIKTATFLHVGFGLAHAEHFLRSAAKIELERPLAFNSPPFSTSVVRREPIGVVSAIAPFNFPFLLMVWKAFPALLMGNTVVAKPNPATPLSAMLLAEALEHAGLPRGVFNLVTGDAPVGSVMASSPEVDKVSFTGSTAVGRSILAAGAQTIKRVTLELGGKSPSIILPDADLDLAVDGILFGIYFYAGQCCEAGSRVFVPRNMQKSLIERLTVRAAQIRMGDTRDWATDMGPVISRAQVTRLEGIVQQAKDAGAVVACGGKRADFDRGYYFQPTILANVENDMVVARDELFGPVVSVIAYDDVDDAVRMANETIYGLAATIWGSDLQDAYEIAKRVRAGTVWINDHHMIRPDAPFGGFRQSGLGRELGDEGFHDFTETKHVYVSLDQRRDSRFWSMLLPED